jgi:hypothetical protein
MGAMTDTPDGSTLFDMVPRPFARVIHLRG